MKSDETRISDRKGFGNKNASDRGAVHWWRIVAFFEDFFKFLSDRHGEACNIVDAGYVPDMNVGLQIGIQRRSHNVGSFCTCCECYDALVRATKCELRVWKISSSYWLALVQRLVWLEGVSVYFVASEAVGRTAVVDSGVVHESVAVVGTDINSIEGPMEATNRLLMELGL